CQGAAPLGPRKTTHPLHSLMAWPSPSAHGCPGMRFHSSSHVGTACFWSWRAIALTLSLSTLAWERKTSGLGIARCPGRRWREETLPGVARRVSPGAAALAWPCARRHHPISRPDPGAARWLRYATREGARGDLRRRDAPCSPVRAMRVLHPANPRQ